MPKRKRLEVPVEEEDHYLLDPSVPKFTSGCAVLDAAIGGGWADNRIINIVGDRSSGKTLLAVEATVNYTRRYPDARVRYLETEAAFDLGYAQALGLDVSKVDFPNEHGARDIRTVEDFANDVEATANSGVPLLYIVDSLDALTTKAEQDREYGQGTYNTEKAKMLSEFFRKVNQEMSGSMTMIVISQLRDKIGVSFGETQTRSGGRALDFYASQVVWLHEAGKEKKTYRGVERVIGVRVKARVKKNKVGLPFREAEFPILFGYGVDDLRANVEWIEKTVPDQLEVLGMKKGSTKRTCNALRDKGGEEFHEMRELVHNMVLAEWAEIDKGFLPARGKYDD